MISFKNKIIQLPIIFAAAVIFLTACNKDVEQFPDIPLPALTTTRTLGDTILTIPRDTLFYKILQRGGLLPVINTRANTFTIYVPDSNAVKAYINAVSGGAVSATASNAVVSAFILNTLPAASAAAIGSYAIVPGFFPTTAIPAVFPNLPLPTLLNPAPTLSAFLRLDVFPSVLNGNYVNNIPIVTPNIIAGNGVIHHTAALLAPPQRAVWERINTDTLLTIFRAAVLRADSGTVTAPPTSTPNNLVSLMSSIGTNLTVFTPTNIAMKQTISAATGGAIPVGAPDAVFVGFIGGPSFSTQLAKGIVVYHIFDDRSTTLSPTVQRKRPGRAFTVNFPTTATTHLTLLSSADSIGITYPPITLMATFAGPFVSSATVKGFANTTASNLILNPTPDSRASYGATPPAVPILYLGKTDQHYTNGVLHYIDQVLRPL